MAHQQSILAWLNDAYGMETAQIRVLENHVNDVKDRPEMHATMQRHLEATKQHAEKVKGCIERLGGSTSAIKTGLANIVGTISGISTEVAQDEVIKNALADYASEHFEIACYTSLIAAAEATNDPETVRVCQEILKEEEHMAEYLRSQLPALNKEFIAKQAAKHQG